MVSVRTASKPAVLGQRERLEKYERLLAIEHEIVYPHPH